MVIKTVREDDDANTNYSSSKAPTVAARNLIRPGGQLLRRSPTVDAVGTLPESLGLGVSGLGG